MNKKITAGLVTGGSAVMAHAEGIASDLGTAATTAITSAETIIGGILVAAFAIVVGFFMFKKAKSAINKA